MMQIDRDNFEYALSQYADGTLNELDRRMIDDRLAGDAEVRLLLSDYRRIDDLLRETLELPAIDFNSLGVKISQMIAAEQSYVAGPLRMRWLAPLAAAALVAIAAMIGLQIHGSDHRPAVATGSAVITGPMIETASATAHITIGVGPSEAMAQRGDTLSIGEEAIAPPSPKVVIGSAVVPGKDDVRPY